MVMPLLQPGDLTVALSLWPPMVALFFQLMKSFAATLYLDEILNIDEN